MISLHGLTVIAFALYLLVRLLLHALSIIRPEQTELSPSKLFWLMMITTLLAMSINQMLAGLSLAASRGILAQVLDVIWLFVFALDGLERCVSYYDKASLTPPETRTLALLLASSFLSIILTLTVV